MKKVMLVLSLSMFILVGCGSNVKIDQLPNSEVIETKNDQQRIDLYVEVLKSVFNEANGGNDFIAVKSETLEGLNSNEKGIVLESLKDLSLNIYDFEDVRNDKSKFNYDGSGSLAQAKDGTLLWIKLGEYDDNSAKLIGTSWFGNLGSVSFDYEANKINDEWELTVVSSIKS